jgi:hypothetical protein
MDSIYITRKNLDRIYRIDKKLKKNNPENLVDPACPVALIDGSGFKN